MSDERNGFEPRSPGALGEDKTLPADTSTMDPPDDVPPQLDANAEETLPAQGNGGRSPEASLPATDAPQTFGRYIVLGRLGRGGMGVVLEAFDRELDRRIALKVLHRELGAQHTTRLFREARAMAKLSHPNVVQVYEVGQVEDQTFIAMELIEGRTIEQWMGQGPAPDWRECTRVFVQLAAGLAAAHEQGMVHRDFKPSNAIIDDKGRARVLDFGLVRRNDEHPDDGAPASMEDSEYPKDGDPLTRTGALMGTPAYMSPEQISGQEADARSDQFSFCISLYEAVYGQRPFGGDTIVASMSAAVTGEIQPAPSGSKVPAALRKVLVRGLAVAPDTRWPSMDALSAQLRALADPRPGRGRWVLGLSVGLAALGGGLALAQYAEVKDRCAGARAQLDDVWGDAQREAVRTALLGTERAHAPGTWTRVERRLDGYAERWVSTHTESCEATRVTRSQTEDAMELRMACLSTRKIALGTVVEVLARADPSIGDRAVGMVVGLPGLERCDDTERLALERQRVPPPEDPSVAEQVEALRHRLTRLEFTHDSDGWARQEAEAILEEANALGYAPLQIEAMYQHGWNLLNLRDPQAKTWFTKVYVQAIELGHDAQALRAAQALAPMRHEEGLWWAQRASVPLARRSGDSAQLAHSLSGLGRVLDALGEYEQAQRNHEEALQLRREALGPRHPSVSHSLNNLAYLSMNQGHLEQAEHYFEESLEIRREVFGPEHHMVAYVLTSLGDTALERGDLERARQRFARALEIWTAARGIDHSQTAWAMVDLAWVLGELGHTDEAERHFTRSLQIQERRLEPDNPKLVEPVLGLAQLALDRKRWAKAQDYAQRVLALAQSNPELNFERTKARFILAQIPTGDPMQHVRARQLATQARDSFASLKEHHERSLVEAWLAAHP